MTPQMVETAVAVADSGGPEARLGEEIQELTQQVCKQATFPL
jgi:hypothetical protein